MFFKPLELPGSDLSGKAKSFTPDKFFQQVLAKLSCIKMSSLEFKCGLLFVAYLFIRLHSVGMALLLRNLVTYNFNKKRTFLEEPYFFANKLSYKDLPFKYVLENEELFFKTFDKLVFFVDTVENKKLIISPSELFDWIPPLLLYKCFCQDKPKIGNFDWYFLFLTNSFESFSSLVNSFEATLFSATLLSKIYDGFIKLTLNSLIEDDLVSFMSFYYYFNSVIFSQVLVDGFFANQLIIREGLEKKFNKKISLFFNNLGQITNEELFFDKSFKLNFEEIKKSLMLRNSNLGIPITLWLYTFTENFEMDDISYIFADNVASSKTLSSVSPLFFYFAFKEWQEEII